MTHHRPFAFLSALIGVTLLAFGCGGAQTDAARGDDGSMDAFATEMDQLGLLPGALVRGEEVPEGIAMDEPSVEVRGLEEVTSLMPLAVTAELELLVEADGERVPMRLWLMSYEQGIHVYGAETMVGYDRRGCESRAAEDAAAFLTSEAKAGRWRTHVIDTDELGTELPATIRMTLMDHDELLTEILAMGDVLQRGRLIHARMGDEVVVYTREPTNLNLFQAVMRLETNDDDRVRVVGPPHVVVTRIEPSELGEAAIEG